MSASQNVPTLVPAGRSNSSRQPLTVPGPVLPIVQAPVKPVSQVEVLANVAVVAALAGPAKATARPSRSSSAPPTAAARWVSLPIMVLLCGGDAGASR
jgi:hypothetical protein